MRDLGSLRDLALRDLKTLRSPEGYLRAGRPRYFSYFSRDAFISAWQALSFDAGIAADTLRFAGRYQARGTEDWRSDAERGMLPHQVFLHGERMPILTRVFWGRTYYGSIDATPLFVILANQLWKTKKDAVLPLLAALESNIIEALSWIDRRLRLDGFLIYQKKNPFGHTHQGWRDGWRNRIGIPAPVALLDAQAYAYAALWMGAELVRHVFRKEKFASTLIHDAYELRRRFDVSFWWQDEQTYFFALAGKNLEPVERITPEPAMALFSGIIPVMRRKQVAAKVFGKELWTPFGVRSLSVKDARFRADSYFDGSIWPWYNWLIRKGLLWNRFYSEAERIRSALLYAVLRRGEIPETYAVYPDNLSRPARIPEVNPVQAWSLGAVLDMTPSNGQE